MKGKLIKAFMSFKVRVLLISLLFLITLWFATIHFATRYIETNRAAIERLVSEQIHFPTTFEDIEPHWYSIKPYLRIKKLAIFDSAVPVQFISIDKLDFHFSLIKTLMKRKFIFDEIAMQGPKLVLGWNKKGELSIFGLKGETIPSSIDLDSLLKAFLEQEKLILSKAEIHWIKDKMPIMTQLVEGEVYWKSLKDKELAFSGKQKVRISEGSYLPKSTLLVNWDIPKKSGTGYSDILNTESQCRFSQDEGGAFNLECTSKADNIDIGLLRQQIQFRESDAAWLQWIHQAIKSGKITQGEFRVKGPIDSLEWESKINYKNIEFNYATGWPQIDNATGEVIIEKDLVRVSLEEGNIQTIPIKSAAAIIGPLGKKESPVVTVRGSLSGLIEKGVAFLEDSPLKSTVAPQLAAIHPTGLMDLNLALNIPLGSSKLPTTVVGSVNVKNGSLFLDPLNLKVTDLNGMFDFTEKDLQAKNVSAQVFDTPFQIQVTPEKVTVSGEINSELVKKIFKHPFILPLPDKGNVVLNVYPVLDHERRFAVTLPGIFDSKWVMDTTLKNQLIIKRGSIALGEGANSDWITEDVLKLTGHFPKFDLSSSQEWIQESLHQMFKLPLKVSILIKELTAFNYLFTDVELRYDSSLEVKKLSLNGSKVQGTITLPTAQDNDLELKLDHLNLDSHNLEKGSWRYASPYPINFYCKNLNYDATHFGTVAFHLNPVPSGYEIETLSMKSAHFSVEAKGNWLRQDETEESKLSGEIFSNDFGSALRSWGFSTVIEESEGSIEFNLSWPDSPFQFSLKTVKGNATFKFKNGRVLGVNPGLGRIFGLLNLDSIRRRLQLDFSDFVKQGFVFDTLNSELEFDKGRANTESFYLNGPSARISLKGVANLSTKDVDLNMTVIPKVTGGSLPIAAAIAIGNPAVGAGLFVFEKLMGKTINNISRHTYHVTGTWDAPKIEERTTDRNRF